MWNDKQRKYFLLNILAKLRPSQIAYMEELFDAFGIYERKDFTRVLPTDLSRHIFAYLSPQDLSRCAQVSSHWKFLTEQVKFFSIYNQFRHERFLDKMTNFEYKLWLSSHLDDRFKRYRKNVKWSEKKNIFFKCIFNDNFWTTCPILKQLSNLKSPYFVLQLNVNGSLKNCVNMGDILILKSCLSKLNMIFCRFCVITFEPLIQFW